MRGKRIGILSDVSSRALDLASTLAPAGVLTDLRDLGMGVPLAPFSPLPDLLIVSFSGEGDRGIELAREIQGWKGIPIVVVSALTLSRLEGPLHTLPIVYAVLFEPYTPASLLGVVEDALSPRARELCESTTFPNKSQERFPNWTGPI